MMTQRFYGLLASVMLLFASPIYSWAADSFSGTWRLTAVIPAANGGETAQTALIMFTETDGKWFADLMDLLPNDEAEHNIDVTIKDDQIRFVFKFQNSRWSFDGRLQPGGNRVKGSMDINGEVLLVDMVRSKLKSLNKDPFAVALERAEMAEGAPEFFNALIPVLQQAGAKKMKVEDVRKLTDKASKLAEVYGTRWQRLLAFQVAEILSNQPEYLPIAVEQARQGERLLGRGDEIVVQIMAMETLSRVLAKAKKDDEVKEVEARIAKLEPRDYADYLKNQNFLPVEEYKGRKGKSDRVVLVEVFNCLEGPASAFYDISHNALMRSYKPADVLLLNYHVHYPGLDVLVAPDSTARLNYYIPPKSEENAPLIFVAGKPETPLKNMPRGPKGILMKFNSFKDQIAEQLEKDSQVKITASATRKGDEIAIKASVNDLKKPTERTALRLALVEDRIRYSAANGLRYHHNIVRAFAGGVKGFLLNKPSSEQNFTVKISEIKSAIDKSLDDYAAAARREQPDYSFGPRPLNFKNLKLIAFVQDDETKEILNAIKVDVE